MSNQSVKPAFTCESIAQSDLVEALANGAIGHLKFLAISIKDW